MQTSNVTGRFYVTTLDAPDMFIPVRIIETDSGENMLVGLNDLRGKNVDTTCSVATAAMAASAKDYGTLRTLSVSRDDMARFNPAWKTERDMTLESFILTHGNTKAFRESGKAEAFLAAYAAEVEVEAVAA